MSIAAKRVTIVLCIVLFVVIAYIIYLFKTAECADCFVDDNRLDPVKDKEYIDAMFTEVEHLNSNSNLNGNKMLDFSGEESLRRSEIGYVGYEKYHDEYLFSVSSYLIEGEDDVRLTSLTIYGKDFHVFGVSVGDEVDDSIEKLEKEGYEVKEEEDIYRDRILLYNNGVRIFIYKKDNSNEIEKISIVIA